MQARSRDTPHPLAPLSSIKVKKHILILNKIDSTHFLHHMSLNDKKYQTKFDNRIRHLAEKYQNESAIFYLDQYANEMDTTQTIESINYIIENKFVGSKPKNRLIELRTKLKRKR